MSITRLIKCRVHNCVTLSSSNLQFCIILFSDNVGLLKTSKQPTVLKCSSSCRKFWLFSVTSTMFASSLYGLVLRRHKCTNRLPPAVADSSWTYARVGSLPRRPFKMIIRKEVEFFSKSNECSFLVRFDCKIFFGSVEPIFSRYKHQQNLQSIMYVNCPG